MLKLLTLKAASFSRPSTAPSSPISLKSESSNSSEWTSTLRLPAEIIYHTIDDYLIDDLPALRVLALSCKVLYVYCRKYIFRAIEFPKGSEESSKADDGSSTSATTKGTTVVERFAALLKGSPEIADLVEEIKIDDLPKASTKLFRIGTSSEEKAFCSIFKHKFSALGCLSLYAKSTGWPELSPNVQSALLEVFQSPRLYTVSLAFRYMPTWALGSCKAVQNLSLCGLLYKDAEESDSTVVGEQAKPKSLAICCLPDESLAVLSMGSSKFSLASLKRLDFPRIHTYSFSQHALVMTCASSLVTLKMEPESWRSPVILELGNLPSLRDLQIQTNTKELLWALDWVAASLDTRPTTTTKFGSLENIYMFLVTDNVPSSAILKTNQGEWKDASKEQHRWPSLKTVPIRGFSRTDRMEGKVTVVELVCLGSYILGGHPKDGSNDHNH